MDTSEQKAQLRAEVRAARARRSPAELEKAKKGLTAALRQWPRLHQAKGVTGFLPMAGEPDLSVIFNDLQSRLVPVWLPVTTRVDGEPWLKWAEFGDGVELGAALGSGVRIPEPVGPRHDAPVADLVLMPALAVDQSGARLGQGGGFYDRTVARLGWNAPQGPTLVAVVFDSEVLDHVPAEEFDTRVQYILTPSGVRQVQ